MPSKKRKQRLSAARYDTKKTGRAINVESDMVSLNSVEDTPAQRIEESVAVLPEGVPFNKPTAAAAASRQDSNKDSGENSPPFLWVRSPGSSLSKFLDESVPLTPAEQKGKGHLGSIGCPYFCSSSCQEGLSSQRQPRFGISSVDIPLSAWPEHSFGSLAVMEKTAKSNMVDTVALAAVHDGASGGGPPSNSLTYPSWNYENYQWNPSQGNTSIQSSPKDGNESWGVSADKQPWGFVKFSDSLQKNYQEMMSQHQSTRFQELSRTATATSPTSGGFSSASHLNLPATPNAFSFPAEWTTLTDGIGEETQTKPNIFVIPLRTVNFTNLCIQFTIQVYNVPPPAFVTTQMLEAIAETPSGQTLVCYIRQDKEPATSVLTTFLGSFKATKEIGLYNIRVRMVIPFSLYDKQRVTCHNDYGVAGDSIDVIVSRNYYRDSKRVPGFTFQLDLLPMDRSFSSENAIISSKAWGLACDKVTNRFYITERVGSRVACVDFYGRLLFRFNQLAPGSQLNRPTGICCDQQNRRIIVCDKDHHRICFFTMEGEYISSFGSMGYQNGMFSYPWDVDVSGKGDRIAVTDSRNKRIQLFDGNGNYLSKYSVYEQNPFEYKNKLDYPRGIAFDPDGLLIYVTDFNTHNVLQVPLDCSEGKKILPHERFARPQGVVVDHLGNLLVADSRNNCVCHLSGDGQLLSIIRAVGSNLLQYPVNMAIMQGGKRLAILDGKGRIHIL